MVKSSLFAWALRISYPRPTNGIAEGYARAASGHAAEQRDELAASLDHLVSAQQK